MLNVFQMSMSNIMVIVAGQGDSVVVPLGINMGVALLAS